MLWVIYRFLFVLFFWGFIIASFLELQQQNWRTCWYCFSLLFPPLLWVLQWLSVIRLLLFLSFSFYLFIFFKSLNDCRAQMLLFMYWHKTKRQNSSAPIMCTMIWAHMDCIGTNIASGDGGGGSLTSTSWILQHSCFYTKTPALGWTQTLTQEEQCTLGKTAGWNFEEGAAGAIYIPPSQLAQDAGSSMSYTVGVFGSKRVSETFHHRPFVSQPCRTLGANPRLLALKRLPAIGDRSSWLQHILCF